jgi:tetrahydromethanopterin S-methyltransferase subunit D
VAEPPERKIKRHRWVGFINGFTGGIGFAIFLIVIFIWLAFSSEPQVASLVAFVILAIIAGLSIFLVSVTVEIYHQAKLGQPVNAALEQPPVLTKLCSKCGAEMKWIPKIGKYYCQNCKSYE